MATTTNFGWTTPNDTDLVSQGAAAIRTLGSAIDTSLVDLKGGTTGQYLKKNSNTDLDYVWGDISAGGMTLISTTTLSGATTSISSIPQTYNNLVMIIRNFKPATDGARLRMRFNSDSTANRHIANEGFGNPGTSAVNQNYVDLSANSDNSVANGTIQVEIPDYTNTATWKSGFVYGFTNDETTTSSIKAFVATLIYNQTTAITAFDFIASSGNITSGSVLLYGVK